MAKKKKRKNTTSSKSKISVEFVGLILILIGVIGIGVFGPVGSLIKQFGVFLVGTYVNVLILFLILLGGYFIVKRESPKFYSQRFIGIYILTLSILGLSHMKYVDKGLKFKDFMELTIEKLMSIKGPDFTNLSNAGGGMVGAISGWSLKALFDSRGAMIVYYVLIFFGIILLFNLSIGDVLDKIKDGKDKFKNRPKREKVVSEEDDDDEDDDEETEVLDKKVIITSHEDAHNIGKNVSVETVSVDTTTNNNSNSNYKLPSLDILDPIKKK